MLDPRLTPARPDLAAKHLEGKVHATRFVEGEAFDVTEAIAPVRRAPAPDAELMTQALKGERVTIYDRNGEGWAWGQLEADGYVGWLPESALAKPAAAPTHKVTALWTLAFPGPSIKLPPIHALPMEARITVAREDGPFAITDRRPLSAAAASRNARRQCARLRRRRRALCRHALPLGRQEQPRHRLLRARAAIARRRRHHIAARQRHAAGFAWTAARSCGSAKPAARRPPVLERPCRDRARHRDDRARQCASHGNRDRKHRERHRAHQGGRQRARRGQENLEFDARPRFVVARQVATESSPAASWRKAAANSARV